MTTVDFITTLFYRVDNHMRGVSKHTQALLYPSKLVTIGILYALKGCGERAFYRWLTRDYRPMFPRLPERTRLFRALTTHRAWTDYFNENDQRKHTQPDALSRRPTIRVDRFGRILGFQGLRFIFEVLIGFGQALRSCAERNRHT